MLASRGSTKLSAGVGRRASPRRRRGPLATLAITPPLVVLFLLLAVGSTPLAADPPPQAGLAFDASRAFAIARLQVGYGPRPAGSPAERAVAEILRRMLPDAHFEAVPGGLRNIVGGLPGREPAIVLGAHYGHDPGRRISRGEQQRGRGRGGDRDRSRPRRRCPTPRPAGDPLRPLRR